jgi:hypothetical protein
VSNFEPLDAARVPVITTVAQVRVLGRQVLGLCVRWCGLQIAGDAA